MSDARRAPDGRRCRRAGPLAALVFLALVLAGCAAGSSAAPAAPAAAPRPAGADAPAGVPAPLPAALTPVRVAVPTVDLSNLPLSIGLWMGWFAEEGLDVDLVRIGGQAALPALLNGEVQYSFGWGSVSLGIAQDAPVRLLAILEDRPPHALVARPEVAGLADLRGRRIAGSRPGGSDELIIEAALGTAGLRLTDVEIVRLGETSTRYAALVAGQADAAALIQPFTAEAEKQGSRVLARGGDVLQLPVAVVATSVAHLEAQPDEVQRFLRVAVRDLAYLGDPANTPAVVRLATAHLDLDPALAAAMVQEVLSTLTANGEADEAVLTAAFDVARNQVGRSEPIPLATVVDYSPLRDARRAQRGP